MQMVLEHNTFVYTKYIGANALYACISRELAPARTCVHACMHAYTDMHICLHTDEVFGNDGWGSRSHEILVGLLLNPDNAYR